MRGMAEPQRDPSAILPFRAFCDRFSFLGAKPCHHPRESTRLSDVRQPANPRDCPLQAESKSRMHEGSVLPQVEVPAIRIHRQPLFLDAVDQLVVVILAL